MLSFFSKKQSVPNPSPHHVIAINYLVVEVCLALEGVGFWEELKRRGGSTDITNIAHTLKLKIELLSPCIDFLWAVTDYIEKKGTKIMLKNDFSSRRFWILKAYKNVFDQLAELISGKKIYGKDLVRDGYYLQKASDLFSEEAVQKVLQMLEAEPDTFLVDLGCGSGKVLIDYCGRKKERNGLGIDIDATIIAAAKQHIANAGLKDAVCAVRADILSIDLWKNAIPREESITFFSSTVMHEFLREGTPFVIDFLKKIRSCFPNSRFFMVEFDALSFTDIKNEPDQYRKLFAAMYELWHPLTNQGMPQSQKTWTEILEKAGWRVRHTTRTRANLVVYDCAA